MIATIAVIAAIAEKKKVLRSQRSQRSYGNHFPEIAATTIAEIELFLPQRSLSLRSLERDFLMIAMIAAIAELFFSAIALITAIVAIIWRPGSSYASVLKKKYVSITIELSKQEGCIMLFTFMFHIHVFFFCRNEKGLLNFVSERLKLVYRIKNTRYNFQKNKLPFKHLKPQFIGRMLSH